MAVPVANPTEFIDSGTADVFIPEIWSMLVLAAREANLVWAPLVDRKYEAELKYGDILYVNSLSNLTIQTKAKSSNTAINYQSVTETKTDITVTTWQYVAMAVESIVKVQNMKDQLAMYSGKMGYCLALGIDDAIATRISAFSNTVGSLATELTDDNILRARQYLNDANAPMDGRAIVISPGAETGFLKLDKYIRDDYKGVHGDGARETGLQQAYVTSFYRMPVYVSTNVDGTNPAGHDNAMLQKESIALVVQMKPTMHTAYDIDYFVDKVAVEQLHGSAEMRDDHGVWMKGP